MNFLYVVCVALLLPASVFASAESAVPLSPPTRAIEAFWDAAKSRDVETARSLMTLRTVELADGVSKLAREIQATIVPENMLESWLVSLDAQRPKILREEIDGDRASVFVRYKRGQLAELELRREQDRWKLDFESQFARALSILEEAEDRWHAARRGELPEDDD